MLQDQETGTIYIPVSREAACELRDWSAPVQVRMEHGSFVFRSLAQPVKGVYITDDDRIERPL